MIRYILIWIFFPLIVSGQQDVNLTDASGLKQGLWKRSYLNGRLMYEGSFKDDKPIGDWRRYHESGVLRALLNHSSQSDTVHVILYDETGNPAAEGYYLGEKKAGRWSYFSENRKISEEEYTDGLKSGTSRVFYPSGELLEESEWTNGTRNGRYRAFYISGKPFLECMYEDDRRNGFCVTFFPSGSMEVDAYYTDDLPDGEWKYYTEKEELRYVLQYSAGVLLNPEVLYNLETKQLEELEKKGRQMDDPEKFLHNPTEYLLRNQ